MAGEWTGRIEFEVTSPRARQLLGMVELVVRMEDVSIFFASRSLAVFDRAELRRWFADSRNPIHVDDITLEARGRKLMMALDMASPIPVPSPIAAQLREVV